MSVFPIPGSRYARWRSLLDQRKLIEQRKLSLGVGGAVAGNSSGGPLGDRRTGLGGLEDIQHSWQ